MKGQHIRRLESQLEQLIEGTLTGLFGKHIHAGDIALQLARAMENNLRSAEDDDSRQIAPNDYAIHTSPDVQTHLLEKHPELAQTLSNHLIELATRAGYRIEGVPQISILADVNLETGSMVITAGHNERRASSTAAMKRVVLPPSQKPHHPQLIIDHDRTLELTRELINIGRNPENHIVINDPFVSRQHIQLRLRFGKYILFDVNSQGGTYVNGIQVREHHLTTGDVIRIGNTQILYLEDETPSSAPHDQTQPFDPL